MRKPVFGVSDQVGHKLGCATKEDGQRLEISNLGSCCCYVRVLRLTNSLGHMEMGPHFKVSSKRLGKPGIKPMIPGLQGE